MSSPALFEKAKPFDTSYSNAAAIFLEKAATHPDRLALVIPKMEGACFLGDELITYGALVEKVAIYQRGWERQGLARGDRVVLVMRPSIELYATVISLFCMGVIPVFIDTGMSREKIVMALEDSKAKVVVGVRKLMRVFWLFKPLRRMQRFCVDGAGLGYQDIRSLASGISPGGKPYVVECTAQDHGLISFTSGSTGRPKGADRTHYSLLQQHFALSSHWPEIDAEIDCNCFPVMVLHNLCCGITTVMPRLDLAAPATVTPPLIAEQITQYKVTRFSGAPAYMGALCEYALSNGITFPDVRDVMTGGATVPMSVVHSMRQVFPDAALHVLYGSTEAEPIGSADYDELVSLDGSHPGYLVGHPADFVQVCIADLGEVVESESILFNQQVTQGDSGEICVSGPHVLKSYVDNVNATRENKIIRADGNVWHRTGDTGYFDEARRLWLTGRVKDRVTIGGRRIEPFAVEKCLDEMPGIKRSALVQTGDQIGLVLQANPDLNLDSVVSILHSVDLASIPIYAIKTMPVDGRHNSKIDRPVLRARLERGDLTPFGQVEKSQARSPGDDSRFIVALNRVDYVTLSSVVTTCIASALAVNGYVYAAMSLLFIAMIADALDGMLARKWGLERNFGRYLDGFMDVLIYLVTPALVMYQWGFNGWYGVFIMIYIAAGCCRLAVFNEIGNIEEEGNLSYLGMPVFWSVLLLAFVMLSSLVLPLAIAHALLAIVLSVFSFLMVYRRPFFKFKSLLQILSVTLGGALVFALWQFNTGRENNLANFFWTALYLNFPIIFGGVLHMIVVSKDWLQGLKIPINQALFGANKTVRGFVVVPAVTTLGMVLLYPLELLQRELLGHSILEGQSLLWLGLLCGLAYVFAELPNSYIKRRMGIGAGETPERYRWLFILCDQLDSVIGVALVYCFVLGYGADMFVLLVLQAIFVALAVKRLLFMAKLKKAPA